MTHSTRTRAVLGAPVCYPAGLWAAVNDTLSKTTDVYLVGPPCRKHNPNGELFCTYAYPAAYPEYPDPLRGVFFNRGCDVRPNSALAYESPRDSVFPLRVLRGFLG